jgi:hypothetical protein
MGIIGNRGLQGQPILPYAQIKSYAGADVFLDLAFVDHTQTPVIPLSIIVEIDDLTNDITMLSPVTLTPTGSTLQPLFYGAFAANMTLQVAGTTMVMTYPYEGSQLAQFVITFTALDTVTGQLFTAPAVSCVIELCAIQTPSGL